MKITTNFSYPNFRALPYYSSLRETPVDRADAMCRSIACEIEFDKLTKNNDMEGIIPESASKSGEDLTADADIQEEILALDPYLYESDLILELRKASGIEEPQEGKKEDPDKVKERFTMPLCGSKLDIRA